MAVTVTPQTFTFVNYDAAEIERLVADLAVKLGITGDIAREVDETSPLARSPSSRPARRSGSRAGGREPPTADGSAPGLHSSERPCA
jgi:hypothetical protein